MRESAAALDEPLLIVGVQLLTGESPPVRVFEFDLRHKMWQEEHYPSTARVYLSSSGV